MRRPTHTCNYCSRSFKRAEHLTRHLRTHTREKPYICQCGTKFTRRDLLTRHWRISEHAQCAPIPATGQQTLENEHDINGAASSHVVPINNISPEQGILVHQVRPDLNDTASDLQPNQPQATLADLTANTQPEEYDDFRDFVNFIDGVGLSAQWTPEFDFDWLGINDTIHTSRRSSQAPDHRTSPEAEEIGTPFSTWLPTAPADDQIIPRPGSIENNQADKIKHGPFRVTEEQRGFLSSLLKEFQGLDPTFEIPSRHTLSRYLTAFFGGFHSHFPFIHTPTYKPTCSPIELTLAMCACGAQYCFEHKCSERLFFMAKAIVFERIQQEQSHFGPETLSSVYPRSIAMPETPAEARGLGPWTPLDLAKTILILVGYATWERKDLLSHAFHMKDVLVRVLRDLGLKEEAAPAVATTSPSARWDHWVQQESSRRTKLVAFCYINVHSIAYNVHPSLWASELHLQLPCCTAEWQATSAAHWIARQRECKETQMPFQQALSILLSGTGTGTTHSSVHPIPSPIGNYILLHALLQRIYVVRDLAYSTTPSGSIPTQDLNLVARALRSWTSLWQQAPESILDPNNESGPIPFTSSALLVVAYVRLSLNIGPHRHLSSRNALATAKGLSELPEIEHNDNLLSALLYSTHALSIPVRLGIDRVARSQAFFWSVQHAISSFECAVFLGKWLCSLSKRPLEDENSLTRSEQRILHWVRCIIREAYAVVDFDEEERSEVEVDVGRGGHELVSLGLAVLKIWSRFFKGNTQWQFVANLGLSLEHFMRAIRATGSV